MSRQKFVREDWLEKPFRTPEGLVEVWLHDDVYNANVHLLTQCDEDKYRRWLKRVFGINDELNPAAHAAAHEVLNEREVLTATVIVMRGKWKADPLDDFLTLMHECFHATSFVLMRRGLKHTRETDEAYAYLHESLVRRFINAMCKPVRSLNKPKRQRPCRY